MPGRRVRREPPARLAALCDHMARHAQALTGEPDLYFYDEDDRDDG